MMLESGYLVHSTESHGKCNAFVCEVISHIFATEGDSFFSNITTLPFCPLYDNADMIAAF